jgi:plasmid stabilization system protein ParE
MRVQFLTPAAQEFLAAVDFYETQASGLGNDFILDVEDSLRLAQEFPSLGSPGPAGTRRIHLHRFPYSVVYRPEEGLLRVIAIEHQRRRPGFWMDRLQ